MPKLNKPSRPWTDKDIVANKSYYVELPLPGPTAAVTSVIALNVIRGVMVALPGVGKKIRIDDFEFGGGNVKMEVFVAENPFPAVAFVAGLAVLAGLGLVAYSLAKISEILEESPGFFQDASIFLLILLGVGVWLWRRLSGS